MRHHHYIFLAGLLTAAVLPPAPISLCAAEDAAGSGIKPAKTALAANMVDQSVYYELTEYLRLDRLYQKILRKKTPSLDINIYDEVPDSAFFENRHARNRLPPEALEKGYWENDGPADEGPLKIIKGKTEGLHPGFFIEDSRGDRYLLKFDPLDHLEMNTAAEVIASRFYYAIGYHVPQYTVFSFAPERLTPAPNAAFIDRSGFKKTLTQDLLDLFLTHLPRDAQGNLRASASKILKGTPKGDFKFQGRRREDPQDTIDHERLRPLRALSVFSALINNNDVRRQNTLDMWVTENGKSFLKHFLIDFNSTFGAAAGGPKPPMFTHEYFIDYGEVTKNIFSFGWRKELWRKRLSANESKESRSPSLGYLDNYGFSAEGYKTQLPHYVFKDLSRADGYWAAKIVLNFTEQDFASMIRAGKFTNPQDSDYLLKIVSERREKLGRYWLAQASPLEAFQLKNQRLSFSDLEIHYGFISPEVSSYTLEGFNGNQRLGSLKSSQPEFQIPSEWITAASPLKLILRAIRREEKKTRPFVEVHIQNGAITRALHQD